MIQDNSQKSYYLSELASLTHDSQVETFGWCSCEDCDGEPPFQDCPK